MNRTLIYTGTSLLVLGLFSLLAATGVLPVHMGFIWPLSLLIPGLFFEIAYFIQAERYREEILIPAGLLIVYSALFLYIGSAGTERLLLWWPVFPLGAGIGFLQAWVFGAHRVAYLMIGQFLGVFSLLALVFNALGVDLYGVLFPIVLILLGLAAMVQAYLRKRV